MALSTMFSTKYFQMVPTQHLSQEKLETLHTHITKCNDAHSYQSATCVPQWKKQILWSTLLPYVITLCKLRSVAAPLNLFPTT